MDASLCRRRRGSWYDTGKLRPSIIVTESVILIPNFLRLDEITKTVSQRNLYNMDAALGTQVLAPAHNLLRNTSALFDQL